MTIKKMGFTAGLTIGGGLMLAGIFVMTFASSAPGGGLMIVLGLFFFVPGAFIAGSTLLAWLTATLYGSLNDTAKRRVIWSVFVVLPVAWIAWNAAESYRYFRPSAIAERERIAAEQATTERAALDRLESTREFLVGAWRDTDQPDYVIVFDDEGGTYSTDDGEIDLYGTWSLAMKSRDPASVIELKRRTSKGVIMNAVLAADDTQLVIELLVDPGNTEVDHDSPTQHFSRIIDAAALPKFDTRTGVVIRPYVHPGDEIRIINGATHRFFEEPVAVSTNGGLVRSGPGLEHARVGSMYKGDPVALIAVTDVAIDEFLWFQIRYRDGLNGYALGGLLCPGEVSIEGLRKHCRAISP